MNILPKKRWHVRTKDNIARVRKDEAAAKESERIRLEKLAFAESEARVQYLRSKAGSSSSANVEKTERTDGSNHHDQPTEDGTLKHVDLFSDYQSFIKKTNDDHYNEKKEEREKYEKQIGYLTYLGQDTNEALKLRSWYEVAPERADVYSEEISEKDTKTKYYNDPLTLIKTLLPPDKVEPSASTSKQKKRNKLSTNDDVVSSSKKLKKDKKKSSKEKKSKKKKKKDKRSRLEEKDNRKKELIDRLRRERLKREAREHARQEELLNPKSKEPPQVAQKQPETPRIVQKYNSQFNPEIAKQNMN